MIKIELPQEQDVIIENVVFDFNGTIATGGQLDDGVAKMIDLLKPHANIYILTSDTYGSAQEACQCLGVNICILEGELGSDGKRSFVEELGKEKTACVGNGTNDSKMFQACALALAVIGGEGCSYQALASADIIVKSSMEALSLLNNPNRIKATLRK